jgi:FlaA1/EpsC-like NDP-sugar epimerase
MSAVPLVDSKTITLEDLKSTLHKGDEMDRSNLAGKTILITGCTAGLGEACVQVSLSLRLKGLFLYNFGILCNV